MTAINPYIGYETLKDKRRRVWLMLDFEDEDDGEAHKFHQEVIAIALKFLKPKNEGEIENELCPT